MNIYPGFIFTFAVIYGLILTMKATMKAGEEVQHRDSPQWRGVIVRDLDPRKPVNGIVLVHHNGRTARMFKDTLKKVNR